MHTALKQKLGIIFLYDCEINMDDNFHKSDAQHWKKTNNNTCSVSSKEEN